MRSLADDFGRTLGNRSDFLFALVLGTLLGAGGYAMRRSKHKILKIPASIYIAVLRG